MLPKKRIVPLLISAIISNTSISMAHPHVKMTTKLSFEYNNNTCKGFWVEWLFDDFFSASIIHEFDKNRDGKFSKQEIRQIHDNAFIYLKHYGYFVYLRKGNKRTNPKRVERFSAIEKNGRSLIYRFYVPLEGHRWQDDFYVSIFDRSFYCAIMYDKQPVTFNKTTGSTPRYEKGTNKNYPVYYDPAGSPDDMTIHKKWKPGLETAYPEEIHVHQS